MGHKIHAEHTSPFPYPAPALSYPCTSGKKCCSFPKWAFFCFLHHRNCPEFHRNVRRHLLHANSCQINHCILQHNPWGGLYLWNLLLSLHFPIYLNHVIHSARRMNATAWDFNPSLLRIWFSERERELEIQGKTLGRSQTPLFLSSGFRQRLHYNNIFTKYFRKNLQYEQTFIQVCVCMQVCKYRV